MSRLPDLVIFIYVVFSRIYFLRATKIGQVDQIQSLSLGVSGDCPLAQDFLKAAILFIYKNQNHKMEQFIVVSSYPKQRALWEMIQAQMQYCLLPPGQTHCDLKLDRQNVRVCHAFFFFLNHPIPLLLLCFHTFHLQASELIHLVQRNFHLSLCSPEFSL